MIEVTTQMAALVVCGLLWRVFSPAGLGADQVRSAVTSLVYYLLLPALVLSVLWQAPLGVSSVKIAFVAASGVLGGMGLMWLYSRGRHMGARQTGAMVLAAGFPNATYLGLPVLESTFGEAGRSMALQYDLFACTPLLLSVGMMVADHYGNDGQRQGNALADLIRVPPLWGAAAGVTLNLAGVPMSDWVGDFLDRLGSTVPALMLLALGMGLSARYVSWQTVTRILPVLVIQLALMPVLVWWLATSVGLSGDLLVGVVLEAAMPAMVLGIVICDRYGLDTGLYATVVTVSTALGLVTLPLWFDWLT